MRVFLLILFTVLSFGPIQASDSLLPRVCDAFLTDDMLEGKQILGALGQQDSVKTSSACVNHWFGPKVIQGFLEDYSFVQSSHFSGNKDQLQKKLRSKYLKNILAGASEFSTVYPLSNFPFSKEALACLKSSGLEDELTRPKIATDKTREYIEHSATTAAIAEGLFSNIDESNKKINKIIGEYLKECEAEAGTSFGFGGTIGVVYNPCSLGEINFEALKRSKPEYETELTRIRTYQQAIHNLANSNPTIFNAKWSPGESSSGSGSSIFNFELELNQFGKTLNSKNGLTNQYKAGLKVATKLERGQVNQEKIYDYLAKNKNESSKAIQDNLIQSEIKEKARGNIKSFYEQADASIASACKNGDELLIGFDELAIQVFEDADNQGEAIVDLGSYCFLKQDAIKKQGRRDIQLYGSVASLVGGGILSLSGIGAPLGGGIMTGATLSLAHHGYSDFQQARANLKLEQGQIIAGFGDYTDYLDAKSRQAVTTAALAAEATGAGGLAKGAYKATVAFAKHPALLEKTLPFKEALAKTRLGQRYISANARASVSPYTEPQLTDGLIEIFPAERVSDLGNIGPEVHRTFVKTFKMSDEDATKGLLSINRVLADRDSLFRYAKDLEKEIVAHLKSKGIKPRKGGYTEQDWADATDEVLQRFEKADGFSKPTPLTDMVESSIFNSIIRSRSPVTDFAFDGDFHGVFTHRFQWYAISRAAKEDPDFLKPFARAGVDNVSDLYAMMASRVDGDYNTLWGNLFDGTLPGARLDAHSPEDLGEFLQHNFPWFQ